MAEPNQKDLAYRRARALYARTKLTPQEVADTARMSVNTVKKVLFGVKERETEAHLNSILKVERQLERHIFELQSGHFSEHKLMLSGDPSKDVLTLAKKLATLMQELVLEPERTNKADRDALRRLLKSCNGNLDALSS